MHTIGAFAAKTHFAALLKQVEAGEEVVITKHGHPVAKLVPTKAVSQEQAKDVIQRLKEFGRLHTLGGDWKNLRDEGRR